MLTQSNQSSQQRQSNLSRAATLVTKLLLPASIVADLCKELDIDFRNRIYSPMTTVWLFITQVLSADHSCQQAVAKLNSWRVAQGLSRCSSETTAYCKARGRLPVELFRRLLQWTANRCNESASSEWLFHGREVDLVDGFTVTMADTPENQEAYPQLKEQRAGCGFPIARLVQVFSLATGALSMMAIGPYAGKETGETALFRTLIDRFKPGQIVLADRYFASFWMLSLGQLKGIDLVARAHQLRKIDFRKGLRLGHYDQLVAYPRPAKPKWMNRAAYEKHPSFILVRHLRYRVDQPGFRTHEVTLATTLLDPEIYTAEELADLYRRRWLVEIHIGSIKTQMQMNHLRCKSPQMVHKEIYCHLIGYNVIRAAMLATALEFAVSPVKLSFKGAMQAVEEYGAALRLRSGRNAAQWDNLLATINDLRVGNRPGRSEPRVVKRRPRRYKLIRMPRHDYASHYRAAA